MPIRWFISKTVREATAVYKHYRRLLATQRDLLQPQAIGAVQLKLDELTTALAENHTGKIRIKAEELQFAAEKWIKPYPHAAWRENVEVLLVALAVAMAIRTFFLQPFKIPTGSMQPTLFGVTSVPDFTKVEFWRNLEVPREREKVQSEINDQIRARNSMQIPTGWRRIKEWFKGNSYIHVVSQGTGTVRIEKPAGIKLINLMQTIRIGDTSQNIWFPPDCGEQTLEHRAGLDPNHVFHPGDEVIKMKVSAGDHLFVDRLTYNFRKPDRGEIVVFQTKGIDHPQMPQDEFYIKRLVVLPHEKVSIGDDRHVRINGVRLDASTPHFSGVYGFDPAQPPRESQFSGHVNGTVATKYDLYPNLAPNFPNQDTVYDNDGDSYMVFGDNTCNSFDSRAWGTFPAQNVIGKSFFVYWPLTDRFGWGNQ